MHSMRHHFVLIVSTLRVEKIYPLVNKSCRRFKIYFDFIQENAGNDPFQIFRQRLRL